MEIEKVKEGKCTCCPKKASRKINGVLYCSHCSDNILLKQIKQCIEGISGAIVTLKVLPKRASKEAGHGKKKGIRRT